MTQLLAWVWAPAVLFLVTLGLGLLVDRVGGVELPRGLVAPVGLVVLVVAASLLYRGPLPGAVPWLIALAALAGLVLGRGRLRESVLCGPGVVAAGLVYLLYVLPVVLSGDATWPGYNFVNDTASNFLLTSHLESNGVAVPTDETGAANNVRYLVDVGYPLGAFSSLAALRPLTGAPLEAVYHPLVAGFAALGAMSLADLARRSGLRAAVAAPASALPFAGVLLFRYALHGAVKEVLLVALIATAVALACVALERRLAVRIVILIALACLAMVLDFSSAAVAFAVVLAAGTLVIARLMPDRPSAGHVIRLIGVGLAVGVVALIPMLGAVLDFTRNIHSVFDASDGATSGAFGQLVRPLPATEAAGVWVSRDYRYPADGVFNAPLVAAALAVAVAGAGVCIVKRAYPPLLLLSVTLLPALAISPLASPYIDGKLLVIVTPAVVFVAATGAGHGLQSARWAPRLAGIVACVALAAGLGLSVLYSYRDTRLAPIDRIQALKDVGTHVPDRGLYLFNEWEEYGKYFLREARVNPATEAESALPVDLRADPGVPQVVKPKTPIFGRWFDLDRQDLGYVRSFAGVIQRRSPAASRPPASFELTYRNHYYELWRRKPGVWVSEHLPLQSRDRAVAVPDCGAVRRLARDAPVGSRVVAAARPRVARISPLRVRHPAGWPMTGDVPGAVTTRGAGVVRGSVTASGPQRLWLRASAARGLLVSVDGRRVGTARGLNTPGQWLDAGTIRLRPGRHTVEVTRPSASLGPGDAYYGYLGPVALEAVAPSRLVSMSPEAAPARLCGRPWDWIEVVTGRR